MARYTVRVELHPDGDYDALHEAMEKLGFVRWSAWNGVKRELPPAEYSLTAKVSPQDALDRAKAAALATHGSKFSVLVTPIDPDNGRFHWNLKKWKD